ncbi:MAG: PSD1 and planctomycete cytochrome C domain-containing protein [Planctomycetes bacterium]|nr:PSD1 and planctomycete cytochrome C domain-containing protein [Planctomycetota bacterium]
MNKWFGAFLLLAIVSPLNAQPAKDGKTDFAHDVVPILKAKCAKCHTNGTYKGAVSFDTRETLLKSKAAVPGKSAESELLKRVTTTDKELRMPPQGDALSEKEISVLRKWIDDGLPWEQGFTFKPATYVAPLKPRKVTLPAAKPGREHPIDRIIDAYFATNKVTAPQPLDDAAFARRVYFDLIGLPPAASELEAFLADKDAGKRTKLIRKLLAEDRSYTDHWLAFWNDMLRNEYKGTGYIDGGRKQITAWLYQALLTNMPYDKFTRELISPTPDSEGFARGIKWRGAVNASQIVELQFSQNIGQVFFGANLKCASCHDSFIDSWKLDDAYGLAAVIADKPLEIHRCDKPIGKTATTKFLFPELGSIDAALPKPKRLEQLAALVTHPENGRFTRTIANRIWDRLMGRGIVFPVDVMGNKPWNADLLDYLAVYFAETGYDLKKLMEHITTSQAYQSKAVPLEKELAGDAYVFRGPELKRLSAEQFVDAIWMLTNTAPTKPAAVAAIPAFPDSTPEERRFVRATLVHCDDLMRSLGRPNREQVVTTRPDQLTTLQALDLANGQTLTTTLSRGAANILKASPKATADELAERLFVRALSRKPTAPELAAAKGLLGDKPTPDSVADLLWAVVMLPEFQLVR